MLPTWMIEKLERERRERAAREERARVQLEIHDAPPRPGPSPREEDRVERGVLTIDVL